MVEKEKAMAHMEGREYLANPLQARNNYQPTYVGHMEGREYLANPLQAQNSY
jgi:hypothetical protein